MGQIRFTGHAKARSRERGIDLDEVAERLRTHTVIEVRKGRDGDRDLVITLPDHIEARVVIENGDMVVITVLAHDEDHLGRRF